MASAIVVLLAYGLITGCDARGTNPRTSVIRTSTHTRVDESPTARGGAGVSGSTRVGDSDDRRAGAAAALPVESAAASEARSDAQAQAQAQTLIGEERERDPGSDMVKIKVFVDPRRQAHVIWGRKDFGPAPLEIERPRNSGPLDLVVVAAGYLPYHARAFTDRDDTVSLHLYSTAEAPHLLGYRSTPAAPDSTVRDISSAIQNSLENRTKNASRGASEETSGKGQDRR